MILQNSEEDLNIAVKFKIDNFITTSLHTTEKLSTTRQAIPMGAIFHDETIAQVREENQEEAEAQVRAGSQETIVTEVRAEAENITEASQENFEGSPLPVAMNEDPSQSSIDMQQIAKEIHELRDPSVEQQFLSGLTQVPQELNEELEHQLTLQELEAALQEMANGKAPGIDGLPVEFYNDLDRDFWNNNDSSNVQQRWSSYPPKEFLLNMSPYAPYGDPRLTPNTEFSSEISSEIVAEITSEISTVISSEISTEISSEINTKISSEINKEISTEISSEISTEISSEISSEISTKIKISSEISTDISSEINKEISSKISTETSSEISTEISSEISSEISTDISSEINTEISTKISSDINTEISTKISSETSSEINKEISSRISTEISGSLEKCEAGGGTGAGPSRSDSSRSVEAGSSKAGKWQAVKSHMHSGILRPSNFGDTSPLSTASTLEHIAPSACRPRPLVRQQSLQQPLTPRPPPPPNDPPATSQSLGQLHSSSGGGGGQRGGARPGARGSPAAPGASRYKAGTGARSRSNPGSWDHMMGQIRTRGMDVKSFLEGKMVVLSLAIGLAEQDDFANLPDLQEKPASQETPPGDKR
ncbi:hypothetical protein QTP70_032985 [Hemibagrus guttatus]|uniref:Uncharacterized protein n=1 Tax=Hemibagrus guttatus TaxID=175788 RepID=A0AAE0QVY4_9TELE|nr:hypothetical protein QTP70_032985 [Hemibagrus guttatus]